MLARLRSWFHTPPATTRRFKPTLGLEALETRETPAVSAITSNFNGTAIAAGNTLWFNSVAKVSGVPATGATLKITQQTVSFNGTTLSLPDSTVVFSPTTSKAEATTTFAGGWETAAPTKFSGNVFLGGMGYTVPLTIPGGSVKSITWTGDFKSDVPGVEVSWKWSAAVYTTFSADPGQLGVKPLDTRTAQYPNSDHAGTPQAFKQWVVGGARGGGGSNYTGSYSGTKAVAADVFIPPPVSSPASLSGRVGYDADQDGVPDGPAGGLAVELRDAAGGLVATATTAEDGTYSFAGLPAGTYQVRLVSSGLVAASVGFVDGDGDGTAGDGQVFGIELGDGQGGVEYNFLLTLPQS